MKSLRKKLKLSRNQVSELSKINIDTIRNIETGESIPRFDTLIVLSRVYKENLILKLNEYLMDKNYNAFYSKLDKVLLSIDSNSTINLIEEFKLECLKNGNSLIDYIEMKQFNNLILILEKAGKNNLSFEENNKAILFLLDTLRLNNANLNLNNLDQFKYSYLEKRLLYSISYFLFEIDMNLDSNKVLKILNDTISLTSNSTILDLRLKIKALSLISYNYHILDEVEKSLEIANSGIEICEFNGFMDNLGFLYFRKSIALLRLKNIHESKYYFEKSILSLKLQGYTNLVNIYTEQYTNANR